MSSQLFKTYSFCFGRKGYPNTKSSVDEISFIKRTGREI